MKTLILLCHILIFPLLICAQPAIQWQKCLGGSNNEVAYSITQTVDTGYIVAGYTSSNNGDVSGNNGNEDFWVIKLDQNGNLEWQKCLGGTDEEKAFSIQQTIDNGYVVAGYTKSNNGDVSGNNGDKDIWVVKLDSVGGIQWQQCLGGTGTEEAYDIEELTGGGYIVAGSTTSNNGDVSGNNGMSDFWLVKLNSSGALQWQQCYGGTQNDVAQSVEPIAGGGYLITGYTYSNDGDVSGNHGLYDTWLIEVDQNGSLLWQKCLGGTNREYSYSVAQVNSGNILVAGSTGSNDGDVSGNHNSGGFGYSYDQWVVLMDASGNIIWQKCLGGTDQDISFSVKQTTDGGFVSGGNAWSINGDVVGNHGSSDFWLVKMDASSNIIWQKCLGGSNFDMGRDMQQTLDEGYVMAGSTMSNDGDVTGYHDLYDVWVVKLEPVASILPITLHSFSGEVSDENISLHWSTKREMNNDHFIIERSLDGDQFDMIGKVDGAGTSHHPVEYNFIDEDPIIGNNYYRLKQVDKNGTASLSEVIILQWHGSKIFYIYPNPATEILNLNLITSGSAIYEIYNSAGRAVLSGSCTGESLKINISNWDKGIYYIRISDGKGIDGAAKFIVE